MNFRNGSKAQSVYPLTAVLVDWGVYGRTLDRVQLGGVVLMALALWTIRLGDAKQADAA